MVVPPAAGSEAGDVVDLCAGYGLHLDEWQRIALEAGLGVDGSGLYVSDQVGVCATRQSGKGEIVVALLLGGLLLFGQDTIACSAHLAATTRISFERLLAYFENFDDLRRKVASVQKWVGREQIRLRTGQLVVFPARSAGALRGHSCSAVILDEAQYVSAAQYQAILPTMAAKANSQVWQLGTVPPRLGIDGEVFTRLRDKALSGDPGRVSWLEWSAAPGCDIDDRQAWAEANPALGGRISLEAVEAERVGLTEEAFRAERLGVWPVARVDDPVIAVEKWETAVGPPPPNGTRPAALGVDAGPDGSLAITAAWKLPTGKVHVELMDSRSGDPLAALDYLIELSGFRRVPVVLDSASAATVLVPDLEQARLKVVQTGLRDFGRACSGFVDDVVAGRLSHDGNAVLASAVAGARKRPLGDGGLFGFDRREGAVVSPVVAAALARWGAVSTKPRTGQAMFA